MHISVSLDVGSAAPVMVSAPPPPQTLTFRFLSGTQVGEGAAPVTAPDGTYGQFTVSGNVLTPNTSPLTPGSYDVNGTTIDVVSGFRTVATNAEWNAAYQAASYGDRIQLRGGAYNPAGTSRNFIDRTNAPSGDLAVDGPVVFEPSPGEEDQVAINNATFQMTGAPTGVQHTRLSGLRFKQAALTGDSNGFFSTSGGANGMAHFNTGGYELDGCTFLGGYDTPDLGQRGLVNAIYAVAKADMVVKNCFVDHAFKACQVPRCTGIVIDNNQFDHILADALYVSGQGAQITRNTFDKKLYDVYIEPILGVTDLGGDTLQFTISDASRMRTQSPDGFIEPVVFLGFTGDMAALNGLTLAPSNRNATTDTFELSFTGASAWVTAGAFDNAEVQIAGLHGDYIQLPDGSNTDTEQDDIVIRGNYFMRGAAPGFWAGGQGIFGGDNPGAAGPLNPVRRRIEITANFYQDCYVNAVSVQNMEDGEISCNTMIRQLGIDGALGTTQARISGSASNCLIYDNISNTVADYSGNGNTAENNRTLTLAAPNDSPANAGDAAIYTDAFVAPGVIAGQMVNPTLEYAIRPGGALSVGLPAGAFSGAYDRATDTYTPRLTAGGGGPSTSFSDAFDRADEDLDVSADWTLAYQNELDARVAIRSNQLELLFSGAYDQAAYLHSGVLPADQFAEITFAGFTATRNTRLGPIVRSQGGKTGYYVRWNVYTGAVELANYSDDSILGSANQAATPGDVVRLEAVGSDLTVRINGTSVLTVTDTALTGGQAGLWLYKSLSSEQVLADNFASGSL